MSATKHIAAALAVVAFLLMVPERSHAARSLEVVISHRGQPVLHQSFGAPDHHSPSVVWRHLAGLALTERIALEKEPGGPLTKTLQGDVVVEVRHGKAPFVVISTERLTIDRRNEREHEWFISAEEIERIAGRHGLTLSLRDRAALAYYRYPNAVLLAPFVPIIASLLTMWLFLTRRKRNPIATTQSKS